MQPSGLEAKSETCQGERLQAAGNCRILLIITHPTHKSPKQLHTCSLAKVAWACIRHLILRLWSACKCKQDFNQQVWSGDKYAWSNLTNAWKVEGAYTERMTAWIKGYQRGGWCFFCWLEYAGSECACYLLALWPRCISTTLWSLWNFPEANKWPWAALGSQQGISAVSKWRLWWWWKVEGDLKLVFIFAPGMTFTWWLILTSLFKMACNSWSTRFLNNLLPLCINLQLLWNNYWARFDR